MLDIKFIAQHADVVARNCELRGYSIDVGRIVQLDADRRALLAELESTRHQAKEVARGADREKARERGRELKKRDEELAQAVARAEEELHEAVARLPNMLDYRVPIGGEEANAVVRSVGTPRAFDFEPKPHEVIGEALNVVDFTRAVNASTSRFYALKNEAVLMRLALLRLFAERAMGQGFELVSPPLLTKRQALFASGYLPFAEKDNYTITGTDLSLIGTSEQVLLGMHVDDVLTRLPVLYLGDSMCFRTEAGSYGRDTAGMIRVHQFYKLEQIVYCLPAESERWPLQCLENEEWILAQLEIPYRVILIASGDLGAPGAIKYDTEAWFPATGVYRETTSNTNLLDYQTRRGNIRYRIGGEKGFPHTISATGFTDRLIAAILENYQRADGSVEVPRVLRPLMGGMTEIARPGSR
ncbi:MAG TPA: serine--tRNA ligase [Gemmatimonadaceae bacterium]|nr:serine--tRNA ligase [Gemmatimonadaceae bacterium]